MAFWRTIEHEEMRRAEGISPSARRTAGAFDHKNKQKSSQNPIFPGPEAEHDLINLQLTDFKRQT
jgi:hypothetical protein